MTERLHDPFPVEISELDGIPVAWAALPTIPTVALFFRRGWADETFTRHGLTHLLEHVACPWPHSPSLSRHATVREYHTVFWAEGPLDELERYLLQLCANLRQLPKDRMEPERLACSIEELSQQGSVEADLLEERYGTRGLGLAGHHDYGVTTADADVLDALATECFTAGNAALSMTFPPPQAWRVPLIEGVRCPIDQVHPRLGLRRPSSIEGDAIGISYEAGVAPVDRLLHAIFSSGLFLELRGRGLGYAVSTSTRVVSAATSWRDVTTDHFPSRQHETHEVFLRTLEAVTGEGHLIDGIVRRMAMRLDDPEAAGRAADAAAVEMLFEEAPMDRVQEIELLSEARDGVGLAAKRALDDAVFVQPAGLDAPLGAEKATSSYDDQPVTGTRFTLWPAAPKDADEVGEIVIGSAGISLIEGDGSVFTIPFEECAGVLRYWAGKIKVHHVDGRWEDFPSSSFERAPQLVDLLRERVGDRLVPSGLDTVDWERLEDLAFDRFGVRDERWMDLTALQLEVEPHEVVTDIAIASNEGREGVLATTTLRLRWIRARRSEDEFAGWRATWGALVGLTEEEGIDGPTLIAEVGGDVTRFERIAPPDAAASVIARAMSEKDAVAREDPTAP